MLNQSRIIFEKHYSPVTVRLSEFMPRAVEKAAVNSAGGLESPGWIDD
jgi:hypothetical protein